MTFLHSAARLGPSMCLVCLIMGSADASEVMLKERKKTVYVHCRKLRLEKVQRKAMWPIILATSNFSPLEYSFPNNFLHSFINRKMRQKKCLGLDIFSIIPFPIFQFNIWHLISSCKPSLNAVFISRLFVVWLVLYIRIGHDMLSFALFLNLN